MDQNSIKLFANARLVCFLLAARVLMAIYLLQQMTLYPPYSKRYTILHRTQVDFYNL